MTAAQAGRVTKRRGKRKGYEAIAECRVCGSLLHVTADSHQELSDAWDAWWAEHEHRDAA